MLVTIVPEGHTEISGRPIEVPPYKEHSVIILHTRIINLIVKIINSLHIEKETITVEKV